ncbi:MAG: FAD-dependent oxidoreductase [Polyangiales bacterium]
MERTRTLILGAGISGLAFADSLADGDYLVVEAEDEIGGYCRTIERDGFVWDYAGHFFHFRHPGIERYLLDRMGGQRVLRVQRESRIWYADRLIDFPFQKNIHQLPSGEHEECLEGLRNRPPGETTNFKDMLYSRYGRGIADKFLIPYNEKLYATDLERLDVEAMGRFFPHASMEEILANAHTPTNEGYNATFTYPAGGAIQYVHALAKDVRTDRIALGERVTRIDRARKVVVTRKREIGYEILVSSAPLVSLMDMCGIDYDSNVFSHNKVQVFNLGFDAKGLSGIHWIYYPQRDLSFYRVGFYDNIFGAKRMSLYVEVGLARDQRLADQDRARLESRVLRGLERCGVVTNQRLVASHEVMLDPAYVHVTAESDRRVAETKKLLGAQGIHTIGRYGSWTYCSIEDNIVEARELAARLGLAAQSPS